MPLTAATGVISLPKSYLAATFAACAQWQTLTEAASAAEALESIYFDALPPPPNDQDAYDRGQLEALRPYIVIYSDEETGITLDFTDVGTRFGFSDSGILKGWIELAVDPQIQHDPQEIFRRAENAVGTLVGELVDQAGEAGKLAISTLSLKGPMRCEADQVPGEGDFVQFHFTITWGRR